MLLTSRSVKNAKAKLYELLNKKSKHGKTVFFGDSLTELFLTEHFFHSEVGVCYNRGIIGNTTTEMLRRFNSNVLAIEPSILVLLGGANDLNKNKRPRDVIANLDKMIATTLTRLPECKVIVQSLYPLNPTFEGPFGVNLVDHRKNEAIQETNRRLKALCLKRGVVYAEIYPLLADENGLLKEEYALDGLHVNLKAYRVISDALLPLLTQDQSAQKATDWTEEYEKEVESIFRRKMRL